MNLQEFAALKVGDKIENPMTNSIGEVVDIDKFGIKVAWSGSAVTWRMTANMTAWTSWNKLGEELPEPSHASHYS